MVGDILIHFRYLKYVSMLLGQKGGWKSGGGGRKEGDSR